MKLIDNKILDYDYKEWKVSIIHDDNFTPIGMAIFYFDEKRGVNGIEINLTSK